MATTSPGSPGAVAASSQDSAYNLDKLPPLLSPKGKDKPYGLKKAGSVDMGSLTYRPSRTGQTSIGSTVKATAAVPSAVEAQGPHGPRWARKKWRKAILTVEASNAIQEKGKLHQRVRVALCYGYLLTPLIACQHLQFLSTSSSAHKTFLLVNPSHYACTAFTQISSIDLYANEVKEKTLVGGAITALVWAATLVYLVVLIVQVRSGVGRGMSAACI
jgi:hypothetical protein